MPVFFDGRTVVLRSVDQNEWKSTAHGVLLTEIMADLLQKNSNVFWCVCVCVLLLTCIVSYFKQKPTFTKSHLCSLYLLIFFPFPRLIRIKWISLANFTNKSSKFDLPLRDLNWLSVNGGGFEVLVCYFSIRFTLTQFDIWSVFCSNVLNHIQCVSTIRSVISIAI